MRGMLARHTPLPTVAEPARPNISTSSRIFLVSRPSRAEYRSGRSTSPDAAPNWAGGRWEGVTPHPRRSPPTASPCWVATRNSPSTKPGAISATSRSTILYRVWPRECAGIGRSGGHAPLQIPPVKEKRQRNHRQQDISYSHKFNKAGHVGGQGCAPCLHIEVGIDRRGQQRKG